MIHQHCFKAAMAFALATIATIGFAEESAKPDPATDTSHIRMFGTVYEPILGQRVVIDALVWHYLGTSGRGGGEIITPTGQVIHVRDAYEGNPMGVATQRLPQGKLVRAIGILELGPGPTLGEFVLATGDPRLKLNLTLESFELIETAEHAWPSRAPVFE